MLQPRQCMSPPCGDSNNPEIKPTANPTSRGNVNVSPVSAGTPHQDGSLAQTPETTIVGDNGLPAATGGQLQGAPTAATQPTFTSPSVAVANGSSGGGGNGLSTGAVAGIAVGTLIIGALLAFLIAFLLFRRTRRNEPPNPRALPTSYTNYSDSTPELVMLQQQKALGRNSPYVQVSQQQTPLPVAPIPSPAPQHHDTALAFLPPPASDAEVASRVAAVFNAVARHVETYYRDVQASITPSMESELAKYGARGVDMVELMGRVGQPTTGITHALAVYVASITGPKQQQEDERSVSVFPETLENSAVYAATTGSENDPYSKAASLHRRITAYLHTTATHHPSSPRSPSSQSYTHHNTSSSVREAAESFSLTFFPWANPAADDEAKDDELAGIIAQALEVQVWLFGQPGQWVMRFEGVGVRGVGVVPEVWEGERRVGDGRVVSL